MVNPLFLSFLLQSFDADPYSGLPMLYSDGNFTETSLIETEVLSSSCVRANTGSKKAKGLSGFVFNTGSRSSPELQMQRRKKSELSVWWRKDSKEADKLEALDVAALRDLGLADSMETFASSMFWKQSLLVPKLLIETSFFAASYIVRKAVGRRSVPRWSVKGSLCSWTTLLDKLHSDDLAQLWYLAKGKSGWSLTCLQLQSLGIGDAEMNRVLHQAEVQTRGIWRVLCRQERDLLTTENHQEFTRKLSNLIGAQ